jgi:two-component system, OmpR family, response regulator
MSTREFQSVLFVDDDSDICSVVQATLGLIPDLNVHTAESGERAIDLAHELRPDLVLMDVMMPGLDGPSTFRRMRNSALLARIPVIFMTAKVLPAEIAQFLQLGAIGVIVKPFDPLKLYTDMLSLWNNGCAASAIPVSGRGQAPAQAQMDSLIANFLRRASADVVNLAKVIEHAQQGDQSAFGEIERISHSIHGAAAMFGFPKMSEAGGIAARMVQRLAAAEPPRSSACESAVLEQLRVCSKRLAREVEAAWQEAPQGAAMLRGPV